MENGIISFLVFLVLAGCSSPTGSKSTVTQFGYIEDISIRSDGVYFATVDYAQWFSGEDANKAGFADGYCSETENCAPNGFYIRNKTSEDRQTLEILDEVVVKMQTLNESRAPTEEFQTLSFEEFFGHYQSKQPADLHLIPFHLKVNKGKIVEIKEQYLP